MSGLSFIVSGRRRVAMAALAAALTWLCAGAEDSAADEQNGPGKSADGGVDAARGVAPGGSAHVLPADLEDVEHMCALLTACDRLPLPSGLVPRDFVSCTRTLYAELASPASVSFSLTLRDCGLRASSCGELRTCALRGARPDICNGRGKAGPVDMCDSEGRAITCNGERVTLVRDCPRGGEQCVVSDGRAACALGSCEKEAAPACSASGTRVLECKKGKLLSLDCGAFGLRCTSSSEGPKCATAASSCHEGTTRCEGSSAIGCWHGHEVRIDCGARGLTCGAGTGVLDSSVGAAAAVGACAVPGPLRTDAGAAAPPPCDPSAAPRCDGATLRYCAFGQSRSYLCKSVGLQRCIIDDKGARCAP